ncbi:hypothetical protein EHQ53_14020 [Leptospira langatensis]|uniref:Phage tail protein n=1 Tax=Leptospira langatensis TaxID=2484983 RepID=A0ABY2MC91_9LEPT|nr:hypothetical protein [Leptospira langatensis]TGL39634.1 hypothetical protein EHQ53_14020 [Leptospira langatensis]
MKTQIDPFESDTGWTVSNGTIAVRDNQEFIASFHSACLLISFSDAGVASKTFSSPVNLLSDLAFSTVANIDLTLDGPEASPLTVKFWSGTNFVEYYIQATQIFDQQVFWNNSATGPLANIDKIEFISTGPVSFFISDFLTFKDQFPIDTYKALQDAIALNVTSAEETQIGTVTAIAGAGIISPSRLPYLDKGLTIKFGNETHKVLNLTTSSCSFDKDFDGQQILGNYTDEPVYVKFPVLISPDMFSITTPGIAIYGSFDAEDSLEFEQYSPEADSFRTDGFCRVFTRGTTWKHTISIQGQSRINKLNEIILLVLKKTFNDKLIIYINGRKHEVIQPSGVQWIEFGDATDLLSRMQVDIEIFVTEMAWLMELQSTADLDLTWTINRLT